MRHFRGSCWRVYRHWGTCYQGCWQCSSRRRGSRHWGSSCQGLCIVLGFSSSGFQSLRIKLMKFLYLGISSSRLYSLLSLLSKYSSLGFSFCPPKKVCHKFLSPYAFQGNCESYVREESFWQVPIFFRENEKSKGKIKVDNHSRIRCRQRPQMEGIYWSKGFHKIYSFWNIAQKTPT